MLSGVKALLHVKTGGRRAKGNPFLCEWAREGSKTNAM